MIDFDYISHRHTDFSDLLSLPLETLSGWITWNLGEHIHGPQKRDINSNLLTALVFNQIPETLIRSHQSLLYFSDISVFGNQHI